MIGRYVAARKGEQGLFELAQNPFGEYVQDVDVRTAFEKAAQEAGEKPDFATLLAAG